MKEIFLSRPTFIAKEYRTGLKGFLTLLKTLDLSPRTIGTTDFPTKSPLDAVIKLINHCAGAIILGYPQICVTTGKVKDSIMGKPFCLGTEWNHIEAGLAHAKGLPILVIHDTSVLRGIFDRGALNAFLYSVDFSVSDWFLSNEISGAVKAWTADLPAQPNSVLPLQKQSVTKPTLKWGCYKFEGEDGLFCPACYEMSGKKIPTTRLNSQFRQCPACQAKLA